MSITDWINIGVFLVCFFLTVKFASESHIQVSPIIVYVSQSPVLKT